MRHKKRGWQSLELSILPVEAAEFREVEMYYLFYPIAILLLVIAAAFASA